MTDIKNLCSSLLGEADDPVPALTFDVILPEQRPVGATATLAELGSSINPNNPDRIEVDPVTGWPTTSQAGHFFASLKFAPDAAAQGLNPFHIARFFGEPDNGPAVYAVPYPEGSETIDLTPETQAVRIR